jgi:hypothetical protein
MDAYFVMSDNSQVAINGALAEFLLTVFNAASASSAVAKRGERASALVKHFDKVPALKEASAIVMETEEETITVKTHNILTILAAIPNAITANELYKADVDHVAKNPSESAGKKGRKALNVEAELLASL